MRLRPRRPGFTLLEVMLAAAIGVLLMAGLYTALNLTLSHAQAGRDKVEQATLARSLFTRIAGDILNNLGPPKPPQSGSSAGGAGGGGGGGGATGGTSTAQTGSSTSGGGTTSGSSGGVVSGLGGTV